VVTRGTTATTAARRRPRWRALALQLVALPVVLALGGQTITLSAQAAGSTDEAKAELGDARAREAQAQSSLENSSAAVQAAGAELARVAAALPQAERDVSVAQGELAGARAKAVAAKAEADRAEAELVAAQREVDVATTQVQQSRDDVNALARRAYQRGRLGGLHEVMAATEPKDALERGELLRHVFQSGTAAVDRITSARLALAGKTAQVAKVEEAARHAREVAVTQEARATEVAAQAQAAVDRVNQLIADRKAALGEAERLREQDRREYEQAQADSRALAEKIRRLEAEAAARAAAARAEAERRAREAAAREAAAREAARNTGGGGGGGSAAPSNDTGWLWPGYGRLTSRYGYRRHPIYGDRRFHAGIDIGGGYGAQILATETGVVIYAGPASGYGRLVVVSHGSRISSAYAHMSAISVREGQLVSRGQTLGRIGNAGTSTGPHLHFEIRVSGEPVDPLDYVSPP
jgi:murein DD-endopeptidase MepM/ murein hydrolase activator NlpD